MDFLFSLASFLAAITLLVFIHEYGHFKAARLCGVKVKRFSIGFGKPFYTRIDRQGTEWALAPFPLGGYISMVDTRQEDPGPGEEAMAFDKKPLWKRSAIVIAGPLANLLFAWMLWSVLLSGPAQELAPRLGAAIAGSVADKAGFAEADLIASIDGAPTRTLGEVHLALTRLAMAGSDAQVGVLRDGSPLTLTLATSRLDPNKMGTGEGLRELGFANPAGAAVPAKIKSVLPSGPAALAGLLPGDVVVAIDGKPIATWSAMGAAVNGSADKPLAFTLRSASGAERQATVTPKVPAGASDGVAKIGAGLDIAGLPPESKSRAFVSVDRGVGEAMAEAAARCVSLTKLTFQAVASMVAGRSGSEGVSGPVGIARQAGEAAQSGAGGYAHFLAYLSLSLFFMNLLPLPGLDGGHLAMFGIEAATRRPLSERFQAAAARVGVSMIAALMFFALYNDISRFFH